MARKSICKGCGKQVEKEDKHVHSGKSYCIDCFTPIKEEAESYKTLISCICEYFEIDAPTSLIMQQIKQYKEQFNYSNSGIHYTLWYLKEIENKSFDEVKYGIALVKFNYDNAKAYHTQQARTTKSMENHVPENRVKKVKINTENLQSSSKKFTLDLDQFVDG